MGVPVTKLPLVYVITGLVSIVAGPLLGKASDAIGKYVMFCAATVVCLVVVIYFTHLGVIPVWHVIAVNAVLFVCITGRMISASALSSGVPAMADRGAYMAINSSLQQLSGGIAAGIAGLIVVQTKSGKLENYDVLGWVVAGVMVFTMLLLYNVHRIVREKA
jgi:predicted MFS family arabinose efflux permease